MNIKNIDCYKGLKGVKDKSVQLVVTSPPYNMNDKRYYKNYEDNKSSQEYIDWIVNLSKEIYRVLDDNGVYCLNLSYNKNSKFEWNEIVYKLRKEIGFLLEDTIIWIRAGFPINQDRNHSRDYEHLFVLTKSKNYTYNEIEENVNNSNLWFVNNNRVQVINSQYSDNQLNSATFPIELPYRCIKKFSNKGDLILDMFSGLGTTAIASKLLNRRFIGFELDKETYNASLNRLNKCIKINNTWVLSDKDKNKFNEIRDLIQIYKYKDDTISFHENLWYLDNKKTKKNKFATKGLGYVGLCKKKDIDVFYHDGSKMFIPKNKVHIIKENLVK